MTRASPCLTVRAVFTACALLVACHAHEFQRVTTNNGQSHPKKWRIVSPGEEKAEDELVGVEKPKREPDAAKGVESSAQAPVSSSSGWAEVGSTTLQGGQPEPLPAPARVDIPQRTMQGNENYFALVIGIEDYPILPKVPYAARDAATVKTHLMTVMGYPEENIILLTNADATGNGIRKYMREWLPRNLTPKSRMFFYFAGHGAPNPESGQAYLVPYDGDPNFLETTGYPIKDLYESLGRIPAKEVVAVLDSCFSGAGGRSVLAKGARPLVTRVEGFVPPNRKIASLTASSGTEITASYEAKGHGLFTYFLLESLRGAGDLNKDGWVSLAEVYEYVKPKVQTLARRENRDQTPQVLPGLETLGEKANLKLAKVK